MKAANKTAPIIVKYNNSILSIFNNAIENKLLQRKKEWFIDGYTRRSSKCGKNRKNSKSNKITRFLN